MIKTAIAGTGIAGVLALVSATPALADGTPPQPSVAFAGHLVAGPGAVTVSISYTCDSSVSPINHLFAAVKQGPQIDASTHTSSEFAVSFYSTNWKSDSGPNALTCDGQSHTQTVVLKKQPVAFWPPSATQPPVHAGPALVQLCLFDNLTGPPDNPNTTGGFAPSYTMEQVHAGNGIG